MWKEIRNNLFNHVWEFFVLIIPSIISIFLAWYPASLVNDLGTKVWITISIVLFFALFISIKALITTVNIAKEAVVILPQLKLIKDDILIFSPSELFATNSIVSIWNIDTVEQNIGYGIIETVNSKKYLQIKITYYNKDYDMSFIKKNKDKIVLRPTISAVDIAIPQSFEEGKNND